MDINVSAMAFEVVAAGLPIQVRNYADDNRDASKPVLPFDGTP